ncbi:MAG: GMC family oxidoreductase [Gemmatimonadota bacterium]|jgi:cholesterol oxidase
MIWDWVIIGSGFGGSVSALRLVEKGYSVLVLEKGRRWDEKTFPKTNWNLRKWLWIPGIGFRGFFKMTFLRHVTALTGVGVGGGSLVYANTLPTPGDSFFKAEQWGHLADWKEELAPHYQTARQMLGVADNPLETAPDRALRAMAERAGRSQEFRATPVGVYFGEPGVTVADPYHGGAGPDRTGCTFCGGCMTGCRYGAKNTLDQNYLWLAERRGAIVRPETEVTWVEPMANSDGARFRVETQERMGLLRKARRTYLAKNVVFAGGVLGTVDLLLRLKKDPRGLPHLSPRVGDRVRTNSEVLVGVTTQRKDLDLSEGIAITSIYQTDDHSSLQPCRYSAGSGFFRTLVTPHAPGNTLFERFRNGAKRLLRNPMRGLKAFLVMDWARRSTALLYMRTLEGYIRLAPGQRKLPGLRPGLRSMEGDGPTPTASIPEATQLADEYAQEVDGYVCSLVTEALLGTPTTAHILGGACMGRTKEEGVVDHRHRVFGHDGLFVIDGSAMSANPGVNPSLTITALAERAMSFIPDSEERSKEEVGDTE